MAATADPGRNGEASCAPDAAPARTGLTVLVLAPTGRDGALICNALESAGIPALAVDQAATLVTRLADEVERDGPPELGAILSTDDALGVDWAARLAEVLELQPTWSDLPLVLLASSVPIAGEQRWGGSRSPAAVADRLTGRGNVTVLDRPVRVAALVSAVQAALRARSRQAEVRELIELRNRALAEAERANRVKGDFMAMMSHELRTPLNAIAGYVDLLLLGLRGPLTAEQLEDLERVRRSQRHLLGVINDILNLARIESGRIEYDITTVPVDELIAEVMPMIEPQLASRGLTMERQGEDGLVVASDREKLRQVLLNLLSNAVKFTPPGGRVTLQTEGYPEHDGAPGPVLIRVSDTGVGIPADKLDPIFEPFVQVRSDGGSSREGTGLGLAISRDLARGMGGDLTAESEVGRGSTFTLTLPRASASTAAAAAGLDVPA